MSKIKINTNVKISEKINIENEILGLSKNGTSSEDKKAYVALKYFDKNFECFGEWERDDLQCFSNFIDKINNLTWKEIKKNSGMRFKSIDNAKGIPNNQIKYKISKDIKFCELRVTEKCRVVGFRINSVFFLCWLDKNHRICPQ